MKRLKQIVAVIAIFVVIPFALLALLWKDRCTQTRVSEVPDAAGAFVAAQVSTDCGLTMKVATEIRLEKRLADGVVDDATVLVLAGQNPVPLHWAPGPTLTIDLPDGAEVVKHKREWNGVTIAYTNIPVRTESRP